MKRLATLASTVALLALAAAFLPVGPFAGFLAMLAFMAGCACLVVSAESQARTCFGYAMLLLFGGLAVEVLGAGVRGALGDPRVVGALCALVGLVGLLGAAWLLAKAAVARPPVARVPRFPVRERSPLADPVRTGDLLGGRSPRGARGGKAPRGDDDLGRFRRGGR